MHNAHILTIVAIEDREAFLKYREAVAPVNAALGGEVVLRGAAEILEGQGAAAESVIAIGFSDADAAKAYIASAEYQALEPLRQAAGRFTIRVVA